MITRGGRTIHLLTGGTILPLACIFTFILTYVTVGSFRGRIGNGWDGQFLFLGGSSAALFAIFVIVITAGFGGFGGGLTTKEGGDAGGYVGSWFVVAAGGTAG